MMNHRDTAYAQRGACGGASWSAGFAREVKASATFAFATCALVGMLLMGALTCALAPASACADELGTANAAQNASANGTVQGSADAAGVPAEEQAGDVEGVSAAEAVSSDAETPGATSVDASEGNYVDPAQTADNSFIYDTSIASLAQEASFHDGRVVQILGEVVGDRISTDAPGHYWITVEAEESNDSSSISVLVSESQAEKIDTYGRYGVVGTRVQVRGVYHQACDEHDGLADIHATSLEVSHPGVEMPDQFVLREFLPGIVLVAVGIALVVLFRIVRERTR